MTRVTGCVYKKLVTGEVVSRTQVAVGHFQMGLLCPHIAHNATPGQFIQVHVNRSYDPLLCRPLAVYRTRGDIFEILFKVVGKGTRLLAEKRIGDTLDIIGPLGTGFPMDNDFQLAVLVAGGMGIASLMVLAETIGNPPESPFAKGGLSSCQITALIGASTRDKIIGEKELLALGAEVRVATEDGSAGHRGMVSELLEEILLKERATTVTRRIFACGPTPMLKAVARIAAQHEIPAYVSLEERMACGVGACLGCACEVVSSGDTDTACRAPTYRMVCVDGPVFDAQEIAWK